MLVLISAQVPLANSTKWPIQPVGEGPQIEALKHRLKSGDRRALEEFWRDAVKGGTPLIEAADGRPHDVVLTFVWRGNQNTENVTLLAPLTNAPGLPELPLAHLPDTDVWYSSWTLRDDFRFSYRFVVNLKPGENAQLRATIDPLNPNKMELSFEGDPIPPAQLSIASMPLALRENGIIRQPSIPAGKMESHSLKSSVLGKERNIWVYTPPGYEHKAPSPYGLLLLFDGFSYQHWIPAPTILDNLLHAHRISPIVAVLIDNPPESRGSDLEYNQSFVQFLTDELLPWIHERWNVTHGPQKVIIGGYSMGGAAAAFAAMRRPDLFGNVLSQSGSFWEGHERAKWEYLASQYEASPKLPLRFFMEAGLLEDTSKDGPTLLAANRHLAKILERKGYRVVYQEVGGTHEPAHWRDTLAQGLMTLAK